MAEISGSAAIGAGGNRVRGGLDVKLTAGLLAALGVLAWVAYQAATRMAG
jgi:hypothetical protein